MTLFNRVIKHERSIDVCYEVVKCFDAGHKLRLTTQVINQAFVKSYYINVKLKFDILKSQLNEWLVCNEHDPICYRNAAWRTLA